MPGYLTQQQRIAVAGVADLQIRLLHDRTQFDDNDGRALALGIGAAEWPLFGMLWPSAVELAARLGARALRPGERILEIGCGLALASLVGHRRGADVTASDRHPLTARFLAHNLGLNGLAPMRYRHGEWHVPTTPGLLDGARWTGAVRGRYELLIGSDLLYERGSGALLAAFIGRHAAPAAEVWIVDPDRGNRPAFKQALAALGFAWREERLDHPASQRAPAFKGRLLLGLRAG